jgi:ubiquitin C-terminal hydrolase
MATTSQKVAKKYSKNHRQEQRRERPQPPLASADLSIMDDTMKGRDDIAMLQIFPFLVACDLFKAGVPLKLLRKILQCLAKSAFRRGPSKQLLTVNATDTFATQKSKQKVAHGLTEIRGIPNYGQTCFLNSVLQALASLEPFLAYLERIIQVQDDLSSPSSSPSSRDASRFSRQLFGVLEAINGDYTTRRVDPRNLLKRIGQANAQFQSNYMEQQDAQEVLQAILGVIITDAQLDSTSSSDQCLRFHDSNDDDYLEDEETLTTVLAGGETSYSVEWSPSNSVVNGFNPLSGDSKLSLSCLVQRRIDEGKKNIEKSGMLDSHLVENDRLETDGSKAGTEDRTHQREEKKQEDFEISIPLASSEDGFILTGGNDNTDSVGLQRSVEENSLSDNSIDAGNDSKEGKMSTSMQILKSTISSITPSPLSGWLGSTLRCCNCKHVRPIQNAPFLDIPVVPRSVSNYLATTHHPNSKPAPPNRSPLPHCSLGQCLEDFTSVERVSDVECRTCTIQAEVTRLEEEVMLLQGAIETMEKRIKKKGGNLEQETKCLREELGEVETWLVRLKTADPDDDDVTLLEQSPNNSILDLTDPQKKALDRCDAKKCLLLTRCPSVLCCHVQRRYFDPNTNRMEKCIQFVEFPQILDLSPYCAYGPRASTPWAAGSPKESGGGLSHGAAGIPYRLQAIIEHRGDAFGGHYVSYRRNHMGEWFRISDNNVTPIPWRQVQTCQAYMLFYEAI